MKKDKAVDIQIKAAEKNGFFGTVNFVPNEIVVDIGTIVVWTNNHSSVHTVTSINNNTFVNNGITTGRDGIPLFDSDYMNTGDKFSYNFTQPGRFDYFDKNDASLKGVVFVKQAPSLINSTLSLLDNEDTSPANVNPISNDFNSSKIIKVECLTILKMLIILVQSPIMELSLNWYNLSVRSLTVN